MKNHKNIEKSAEFLVADHSLDLWYKIPNKKEYKGYIIIATENIKKYRKGILKNKKVNKKSKTLFYLSYLGRNMYKILNIIRKKISQYVFNKILQKSDLIICVSKAVKKSYEQKYDLTKKKVIVIYNGISNAFFDVPKVERKNRKIENIIYVGRLEKVKGVDILINAFSMLVKENKNLKLNIVGERYRGKKIRRFSF